MRNGKVQAKDLPDDVFLATVDRIQKEERRWTFTWDIASLGYPRASGGGAAGDDGADGDGERGAAVHALGAVDERSLT